MKHLKKCVTAFFNEIFFPDLVADFTNGNIRVTKTAAGDGLATKDVQSMMQYFYDR